MTLTEQLQELLPYVANIARNPVRQQVGATDELIPIFTNCRVCTTPTDGYDSCYQCHRHRNQFGEELADLVIPLSYGVKGHATLGQYYADLQNYKNGASPTAARSRLRLMAMFYEELHRACAEVYLGAITSVLTVPSGRARPRPHPLQRVAATVKPGALVVDVEYTGPVRTGRSTTIDPNHFEISCDLSGHVQVVEDAWVQGINAQSVAIAARRAGAGPVSILVFGRVLDANWGQSAGWIERNLIKAKWSPYVCPVTGSTCP